MKRLPIHYTSAWLSEADAFCAICKSLMQQGGTYFYADGVLVCSKDCGAETRKHTQAAA